MERKRGKNMKERVNGELEDGAGRSRSVRCLRSGEEDGERCRPLERRRRRMLRRWRLGSLGAKRRGR